MNFFYLDLHLLKLVWITKNIWFVQILNEKFDLILFDSTLGKNLIWFVFVVWKKNLIWFNLMAVELFKDLIWFDLLIFLLMVFYLICSFLNLLLICFDLIWMFIYFVIIWFDLIRVSFWFSLFDLIW